MNLEFFLECIVKIIRYCQVDEDNGDIQSTLAEITSLYHMQQDKKDFLDRLYIYVDQDIELYFLILSTLYEILKDEILIEQMEQLLFRDKMDLFVADSVIRQIRRIKFLDYSIGDSYSKYREIQKKLLYRFKEEYLPDFPYTTYAERNKKRIVIATDQLLSVRHAPTRIVLDVCSYLINDYGYEVFLLVNLTNSDIQELREFWCQPVIYSCIKELNGTFQINYNNTMIRGYQYEWKKNQIRDIQEVCRLIWEWKPICAYYIGGTSYRHDIYKFYTTLISMQCTDGYSVSEAQVLASYMHSNSQYVKESLEYIASTRQHVENIGSIGGLWKEYNHEYKREEFGISEDSFLLCIMGNRLDAEMSTDFIQMLEKILDEQDDVCIAFIGDCIGTFFDARYLERVFFLGYQTELVDVMRMMDLFVNPPRKGGGGGAECALQAGVPVATLANNDVANAVNEASCCYDLSELKALILRYREDKDFYQKQVAFCNTWKENKGKNDDSKRYGTLIERVIKLLEDGVVE